MASLLASPTKEPQDNLDDTSLFMSMEATVAESGIHGVDYGLFAINPAGQLPCPQDVEEFRGIVSLHRYSKGFLLIHTCEDVRCRALMERYPEVTL